MSAENVWNCISAYRSDSATRISKLYDNNLDMILSILTQYYDGVDDYHGHLTGKTGKSLGTSPDADKNLDNAVSFLRTKGYSRYIAEKSEPEEHSKEEVIDTVAKSKGIKKHDRILDLLTEHKTLVELQKAFDTEFPDWKNKKEHKEVKELYDARSKMMKQAKLKKNK